MSRYRVTTRGKVVFTLGWIAIANVLAAVLPFWWTHHI